MLVTLIGKKSLNRIVLPEFPRGNYWLCDESTVSRNKLINIESINGKWQIKSSLYAKIIDKKSIGVYRDEIRILGEKKVIDKVYLKEYETYCVKLANQDEIYLLYCSPVHEKNFLHFHVRSTNEVFIGRDKNLNHIVYDKVLVNPRHAKLYYESESWKIQNFDRNFNTYVNGRAVSDQVIQLENGDTIFILGLQIIVMGKDLFINNPDGKVKLKNKFFDVCQSDKQKLVNKEDQDVIPGLRR